MYGNNYLQIKLDRQEKTEFFFEKKISEPEEKIICIDFRFQKYSEGLDIITLLTL